MNEKDKLFKRLNSKIGCYKTAEEIKLTLSLCTTKQEMRVALAGLGLKLCNLTTETEHISCNRPEWRGDYMKTGQAVYISPFYGVVRVVDYKKRYVDAIVLLDDRAVAILSVVSCEDEQ